MAIPLIEGFDNMAIADVALCYPMGGGSNSLIAGVVEGSALRLPNGGSWTPPVPANAEYKVGFHFWSPSGTNPNGTILQFMEGSTEHVRVAINADQTITISRAGSIPASSAVVGPFLPGIPHWLEVYAKVDNAAGAWEVKLDGATIIGPTGSLDTNNAGAVGTINAIRCLGGPNISLVIDNVYAASGATAFLGEGRCVTDLPTADGTNTAWTASSGTDVSCVDDTTQNGDTDYISSSTSGHIDTFTMATLGVTGTIKAVAIRLFGRKDDAGARTVVTHIRRAATEYDNATSHVLSTSTAGYQGIWEVDPSTGVAWVDSDIDGAEYGVKNV